MQVGPPFQSTRAKRMRSRLQRARSHVVVDGKETSVARCALCPVHWDDHGPQLMAYALCATARAGLPKRDPVEALSNGGIVAELLTWDSLRGNKLRGSTGGRPWFGVRNDIHLAPAICGAICTGLCHAAEPRRSRRRLLKLSADTIG